MQSVGVVSVAMGDDDEVQSRQVNLQGGAVGGEPGGRVAGVEQDALAAMLDERGEPPIQIQLRFTGERIGDDRDASLRLRRRGGRCG